MYLKKIFIYNSTKLFEILNEIKTELNYEVNKINKNDHKKKNFEELKNSLIISTDTNLDTDNSLVFKNLPIKIYNMVEIINLRFLKNQFKNQSEIRIGRYYLNLNSRKISFQNIYQSFTERECNLIIFIHLQTKVSLEEIQKNVWNYSSDLETHTVETHIYRIRKKMMDTFNDNNFIKFDKNKYFLNQ